MKYIILMSLVIFLNGCSTMTTEEYQQSIDNLNLNMMEHGQF